MKMANQHIQQMQSMNIGSGFFRILLIEDDSQIATMIELFCKMHDCVVDHVNSCSDALKKAKSDRYDLAMLDVQLSDGSGLTILPELKQQLGTTKIMTMTGHNPKEVEQTVREHGVVYHLIKPFRLEELKMIMLLSMENKQAAFIA